MKLGKEIKDSSHRNFSVAFGSIDKRNTKAVYVNISSWADPKDNIETNYSRVIRNLNKQVKQQIFNYLSNKGLQIFTPERTIVDLDIRDSGVRFGKRSFMNCEITLYLSMNLELANVLVKEELREIISLVINGVFDKTHIFKFNKRKK